MNKSMFRMNPTMLEQYMGCMKKCAAMQKKKGAGSYTRKVKHKKNFAVD